MEQYTAFASSRGFLKSCASHNRQLVSSSSDLDEDLLSAHIPGASIYVCTDALRAFSERFLARIAQPFVLVSGDSDTPLDDTFLADPRIAALLASTHLMAWFGQNVAARHPKLFHLPIGLDYHTMWQRPGFWGLTAMSPLAQEHALLQTLAESPEFNQRYLACYCNWHFALGRGDRQECFDRVDKSICFFEPNQVTRGCTWQRQAECMFVISPEGAGLDCHRTWEALLLGCAPVVRRGALAPLFERLPVLTVDDWAEVTRDRLMAHLNHLQSARFDFTPLFREHWMSRIAGRKPLPMDEMTFADFRRLLTRRTG